MPADEGPSCGIGKMENKEREEGSGCEGEDPNLPCLGKLKEELTCSICLDICVRPCTTPCGHNFCRRCLRGALQYSMKCPKCREPLPHGFPLNINTVLWNTIQLLFPKVCSMPSSPSSQCAAVNPGRDTGEQYGFLFEAESEILQMERESLVADGHESLDFLLSRLDISDPYTWDMVGRTSGMRYQSPQFASSQTSSPSHAHHQDHHVHGPVYQDVSWTNALRPRARVNHNQEAYSARSRRRQLRYMSLGRGVDARQPLPSQASPVQNGRAMHAHSERRNIATARQTRGSSIPMVAQASPLQDAASVMHFPQYDRATSFVEWGNPDVAAVSQQSPHISSDWRRRHLHVRDLIESPQESYGSPTSISPVTAEGNQRYFDEEWLEVATESDRVESYHDAHSPPNSWGANHEEALDAYLDIEGRENLDLSIEDHDRIDLSEYQLIEGIDGPRIIPRRQRGNDGRGGQRMSGHLRPVALHEILPQSQNEGPRVWPVYGDNHENRSDWPASLTREEANQGVMSSMGSGNSALGNSPSWSNYRELRRQLILAENSAESDGSSIDLDTTMSEGLLPYLGHPSTSSRSLGYRGRYLRRGNRGSLQRRHTAGQENQFPRDALEPFVPTDRAIAQETFDRLYNISHQLSSAVSGINLAQHSRHPLSSNAQFGEDLLHSGSIHDPLDQDIGVERAYADPVADSHGGLHPSFEEVRQSEEDSLYIDDFQFQRAVRNTCHLNGGQSYDFHM